MFNLLLILSILRTKVISILTFANKFTAKSTPLRGVLILEPFHAFSVFIIASIK